jgi:hypothetical protein
MLDLKKYVFDLRCNVSTKVGTSNNKIKVDTFINVVQSDIDACCGCST